jgi:hypothetical protein
MLNDPAYQQLRKHGFIEGLGMSDVKGSFHIAEEKPLLMNAIFVWY